MCSFEPSRSSRQNQQRIGSRGFGTMGLWQSGIMGRYSAGKRDLYSFAAVCSPFQLVVAKQMVTFFWSIIRNPRFKGAKFKASHWDPQRTMSYRSLKVHLSEPSQCPLLAHRRQSRGPGTIIVNPPPRAARCGFDKAPKGRRDLRGCFAMRGMLAARRGGLGGPG